MNLTDLGWNSFFEKQFEKFKSQNLIPARIAQQHRNVYFVYSQKGELKAQITGKMRHGADTRAFLPVVGDWVAIQPRPEEGNATIHAILSRKSWFSRKAVLSGGMPDTGGKTEEQVLVANVDTVFLVSGLDQDFNLRRIERYLTVAWESGAAPVIVLNKTDLCSDLDEKILEVQSIAFDIPILPISAMKSEGLDSVKKHLGKGKTAVLLGSSGVGKSTIINSLLGKQRLKVRPVREYDSRGRHTTAFREMILLSGGGILIDTPGMRELSIWSDQEGLKRTFDDIEKLTPLCRFRDCSHQEEPGCAVKKALEEGTLDFKRYKNYLKLQKELKHLALRKDEKARRKSERAFDKKIRQRLQMMKKINKNGKL